VVYSFHLKRSLVSFVEFILRYFIVLGVIVNGIVSLICALLVYRKVTGFCKLTLCTATLLKVYDF
jgi:hypothetical protein